MKWLVVFRDGTTIVHEGDISMIFDTDGVYENRSCIVSIVLIDD